MIQPLVRVLVEESEDGTQTTRLPNGQEMMDKINEIIKYVNMIDQKVIGIGSKIHKQEISNKFKGGRW